MHHIHPLDRRHFLRNAAGAAVVAGAWRTGFCFAPKHNDDALLDDLSHRCFLYFADAIDPDTGICKDLIHGNPADSEKKQDDVRGSTGVTGFALTALCIGVERKWMPRNTAKELVRRCLRSYTNGIDVIEAEGADVGAVLNDLKSKAAGIETRLFKGPTQLNRFVNVYVNDEDIRFLKNLETPVKAGDEISIVPAIAGG